ncbi:UNVERIFIED_CONTAM: hypothetical protein K2H54_064985 [Gekko kuhli]
MAKRGHDRTAEECRKKTKAMRMKYRQVLDNNSRPGNRRVSCPYFRELHQILKGEGLLRTRGQVATAITFRDEVPEEGVSQDLFCPETVNLEDIRADDPLEEPEGAEEAVAEDFIDLAEYNSNKINHCYVAVEHCSPGAITNRNYNLAVIFYFPSMPNTIDKEEAGPSHHIDSAPSEPHTIQAEPEQHTTARRKRLCGLYGVAERLMEQSERQHAAQLELMDSHHAEQMEARRQEAEEAREAREMLHEAFRRHDEVLQNCPRSLSRLTGLLERELQNRQDHATSGPVNRGGGRGERKSAGCPRERLSP